MKKIRKPGRAKNYRIAPPKGARFYQRSRSAVSGSFIRSLREDGVSEETIKAIRRDNEHVARS